jgi:hypothetical protein
LFAFVNGSFLPAHVWALGSVELDQGGAVDLAFGAGEFLALEALDFSSPSPVPISQDEACLSV